jgi:hypothetical protein
LVYAIPVCSVYWLRVKSDVLQLQQNSDAGQAGRGIEVVKERADKQSWSQVLGLVLVENWRRLIRPFGCEPKLFHTTVSE